MFSDPFADHCAADVLPDVNVIFISYMFSKGKCDWVQPDTLDPASRERAWPLLEGALATETSTKLRDRGKSSLSASLWRTKTKN